MTKTAILIILGISLLGNVLAVAMCCYWLRKVKKLEKSSNYLEAEVSKAVISKN